MCHQIQAETLPNSGGLRITMVFPSCDCSVRLPGSCSARCYAGRLLAASEPPCLDAKQVRIEQLVAQNSAISFRDLRTYPGSKSRRAHLLRRLDRLDSPGDKTADREHPPLRLARRVGLPDRLRMRIQDGVHRGSRVRLLHSAVGKARTIRSGRCLPPASERDPVNTITLQPAQVLTMRPPITPPTPLATQAAQGGLEV